jgi:hypothetical protein
VVNTVSGSHRQLTIYSYNSQSQNYSVTTITSVGTKSLDRILIVRGNLWTYTNDSEPTQVRHVRNVTEYDGNGTAKFKIEESKANEADWIVIGRGTERKIGE